MGDKTGIEWTDATWNPVTGCTKVSAGCDHCYAIRVGARLQHLDAYEGTIANGAWTGRINLVEDRLDQPIRWRKPRKVFVNSMSDLFHPDVPIEFVAEVWAVMSMASQHQFQILTKRPKMMPFVGHPAFKLAVNAARLRRGVSVLPDSKQPDGTYAWPLPNVWLGTSIESDQYAFRADRLREAPATVRFLSLEPLLGPLPSLDLADIDWVIVGGESGSQARPMHPGWVSDVRDRCVAAEIPFFFKQWGEWSPGGGETTVTSDGFPPVVMSRQGRGAMLDGRTWKEMYV